MKRTARSSEPRRSAPSAGSPGAPPPEPRASTPGRGPGGRAPQLPQRTCVACRSIRAKRDLVRVVRAPSGELSVDARGKAPGRGAYLDPVEGCLERGLTEGALARALETPIDAITADRLRVELAAVARTKET